MGLGYVKAQSHPGETDCQGRSSITGGMNAVIVPHKVRNNPKKRLRAFGPGNLDPDVDNLKIKSQNFD